MPLLLWSCSGWGLPSQPVAWMLVSSYLAFPPLPVPSGGHRRYISVALSLESPPLGVTQHPALWSSDFPQAANTAARDHSAYLRPCRMYRNMRHT